MILPAFGAVSAIIPTFSRKPLFGYTSMVYCAVMYEYYFEKDQAVGGSFLGGHRHDWENIVVFTQGNNVVRVAPSYHGRYDGASNSFLMSGRHPLLVLV